MNVLERLIGNLARLPGLGKKSASRIAYFLLRADETLARDPRGGPRAASPDHPQLQRVRNLYRY